MVSHQHWLIRILIVENDGKKGKMSKRQSQNIQNWESIKPSEVERDNELNKRLN